MDHQLCGSAEAVPSDRADMIDLWEFPKVGDPNILP